MRISGNAALTWSGDDVHRGNDSRARLYCFSCNDARTVSSNRNPRIKLVIRIDGCLKYQTAGFLHADAANRDASIFNHDRCDVLFEG